MQTLVSNAGDILEEIKEADMINCTVDDEIHTFTFTCGAIYSLLCCP